MSDSPEESPSRPSDKLLALAACDYARAAIHSGNFPSAVVDLKRALRYAEGLARAEAAARMAKA